VSKRATRCRQVDAGTIDTTIGGLCTRTGENMLVVTTEDTSRFAFACFTNVPDPETFETASLGDIRRDSISTIIKIDILRKRLSRELNTDSSRQEVSDFVINLRPSI